MSSTGPTGTTQLGELLTRDDVTIVPGASTPLFARLVEEAGFDAVYLTGAGVANTLLDAPDIGLLERGELLAVARAMVNSVQIPVIADVDAGFGGIANIARTVREFEDAGVAALQIEDQLEPKRCGHFAGKAVVGREEMLQRVHGALRARRSDETRIIARTDARQVLGLNEAIERARLLADAGADAVFVEAPESTEELAAVPSAVDAPAVANMVEGGATPLTDADELGRMGYRLVLFANTTLRVATRAISDALTTLRNDRSTAGLLDRMDSWERRQALVGLPAWQRFEDDAVRAAAAQQR